MTKKKTGEVSRRKGHEFEKKVARWVRRVFDGETETNRLLYGATVKRPYEIDVHLSWGRIFKKHVWFECKSIKSRIKRNHVLRLLAAAEDIDRAKEDGKEDFRFDYLGIVSTSDFDIDALSYAEDKDIACLHYDGRRYHLRNEVSWMEP